MEDDLYLGNSIYDYMSIKVKTVTLEKGEQTSTFLDLRRCTEDDLSKFYPLQKTHKKDYGYYKGNLLCFDHSKLKLAGNINT